MGIRAEKRTNDQGVNPSRYQLPILLILITGLIVITSACTRQTIPFLSDAPQASQPTEPPPAATLLGDFVEADSYSVAWIPEGEELKIHNPAGIAGTVIGELAYDQSGIQLTGGSSSLGSSLWVEIKTPEGTTGWVNEWNLTETTRSEEYCSDGRVPGVLTQVIRAIEARDGQMLAEYVNPERGLIVRHDWWNPEVIIPYNKVSQIFEDRSKLDWGVIGGGDFQIEGSFDELIRPLILETVSGSEPVCNELPIGTTTRSAIWPTVYTSLNYYAFYHPAPENGNPFNWRTWAFTFEYIGGRPYLTVLVQFHGDI
jgi:hypothetical protein